MKEIIVTATVTRRGELKDLLDNNAKAKAKWLSMTAAQQRMLREEGFAAKSTATRTKRAEKWLV